MVGKTIAHYRIVRKLGQGGMGEVFLAEDTRLHRRVALKTLPLEMTHSPERLQRFEREAKAVAALNHPNIVTIYSVEEADGVRFITMELLEGSTLGEILGDGPLPVARMLELATPLADALAAVHEKGVLHRDLKPGNVMVTPDGRVKLLDFGVAKLRRDNRETEFFDRPATQETQEGWVLGTLQYMAPEQLAGRSVDQRADIYSFGVILYEMATGRLPFDGGSSAEKMASILRDEPRPVEQLRPDLPAALAQVLHRCLERDPEKRYATARALATELAALKRSADLDELVASGSLPTRLPRRPRPEVLALGALLAAAVVLALVLGLRNRSPAPAPKPEAPTAPPSLAVLPLGNFSNDPEYFVDGMTDALISSLANIRGLRVISRQSVMRFKASDKPLPEIARELGVDLIVEGSMTRDGERMRITTQLVRAHPEQQLWSKSYDREVRDVLALQAEVAQAIAREVSVTVTPQEQQRFAAYRQVDPKAYEAYLQGRFALYQRTTASFEQAIEGFERAIKIDPTYATAYAGLADTYSLRGFTIENAEDAFNKAKQFAAKALEMDPQSSDAHVARARILLFHDWDWAEAKREIDLALDISPANAEAHFLGWAYYVAMGDLETAGGHLRKALESDPLSARFRFYETAQLDFAGDYQEALQKCSDLVAANPQFGPGELSLATILLEFGRNEEAVRYLADGYEHIGYAAVASLLRSEFALHGFEAAVRRSAEALARMDAGQGSGIDFIAGHYAMVQDRATTLEWLERAVSARAPTMIYIKLNPSWRFIRDEPRYQALLRKMGLDRPAAIPEPGPAGRG
ncbi:MAG: protein kinase [Thermoanaerobaculia bacterium]